jgi:hypothetical protein
MQGLAHGKWLHWQPWLVRQGQGCMLWWADQPCLAAGQLQDKHVVVVIVVHQALGTCRHTNSRQQQQAGNSRQQVCVAGQCCRTRDVCFFYGRQGTPDAAGTDDRTAIHPADKPRYNGHILWHSALPRGHITHQLV